MIQLHDHHFEPYLSAHEIKDIVAEMAQQMESLKSENPHFLVVLKGSFLFAADLLQQLSYDAEVSFIQLQSYQGTESSGVVNQIVGLQADIQNKTVVVLEDIVDTGTTLKKIYSLLEKENPAKIYIASLLFKPSVYQQKLPLHYVGKEIPNKFVVGYGLDYKELGRTLSGIYQLKNNNPC